MISGWPMKGTDGKKKKSTKNTCNLLTEKLKVNAGWKHSTAVIYILKMCSLYVCIIPPNFVYKNCIVYMHVCDSRFQFIYYCY